LLQKERFRMKTVILKIFYVLSLSFIVFLPCVGSIDIAASESQISLTGTYRLVSFETRYDNGEVQYPFGRKAVGQLTYDVAGNMSALVMNPDCPAFKSGERLKGTDSEVRGAFENFIGYFGTYMVDAVKGTVIHHVLGASYPNWVGVDQIRYYKVNGARLTLSMPPKLSGSQRSENIIIWERIK
jgi:hypothetical protein